MQLRLARLAWTCQPEREARDQRFAGLAAVAREPHQLLPALGQDPLERALDAPRRHPEVLGDLRPPAAVAMESDDLALAVRKPREHRARDPLDLGLVLALDQQLAQVPRAAEAAIWNSGAVTSASSSRRERLRAASMWPSSRCVVVRSHVKTSPSVWPRQLRSASRHASWNASSTSSRLAPGCQDATCERSFAPSSPAAICSISPLVRLPSARRFVGATTAIEQRGAKLAPLSADSPTGPSANRPHRRWRCAIKPGLSAIRRPKRG